MAVIEVVVTALTLSGWWCSACGATAEVRPTCDCPDRDGLERRLVTRGSTIVQLDAVRPNSVTHDRWQLAG